MADKLFQVLTRKPGAANVTIVDAQPSTLGYRLMSYDLGSPSFDKQFSGPRGTQGAVLAGATAQNRVSTFHFQVVGTSHDDLEAKLSALWQLDDDLRRYGGTITWRSEGSSFRMKIRALDSGIQIAGFDRLWEFNHRLSVDWAITSPPYMEGEPLDIVDDFSADTKSQYTFDTGSAADVSVTGGQLTSVANPTVEKRMIHTDRGYTYGDQQVTIKAAIGNTVSSFKAGVVLKRIDAANYLEAYIDDDGANSRIRIDKVVAGARTNLVSANLSPRMVAGQVSWVRGKIEGNQVTVDRYTHPPSAAETGTDNTAYFLTAGAEQNAFGTAVVGRTGLSWIPQHAAAIIDDFAVEPFTYRAVTLPDTFRLNAPIPGDAPALVDAYITPTGGSAAPIWALLGWWSPPAVFNMVQNGDFELSTLAANGWSVASVTNINAGAATSVTRTVNSALFGSAVGRVVTPATADTGVSYRIFRKFKRGVTYTFDVWVRAPSGSTTNVYARFGNGPNNDKATSGNTALSATPQKLTIAWTPTADRDDAHIAVNVAAATGTTFDIDGVTVYEGTTPPATINHLEGRGGFPPFGIIEGENNVAGTSIANSGNYRSSFAASSTGNNLVASVIVDPTLAVPDDYGQGDIAVEVWARIEMPSTLGPVTGNAYASALSASTLPRLYTDEFGAAGRAVGVPSSGTQFRLLRMGVVRLPTNLGRWQVSVDFTRASGSGTWTVDYIVLVPANARALSPTGKVNDATYPDFAPVTTELTRRIRSDLTGTLREPTGSEYLAPGLGGSLLELPPGNFEALAKLSSLVPDDPTVDATSEQLAHTATLHFAITPRWRLGRSS